MQRYKTSLNKFKRIEIISSIYSDPQYHETGNQPQKEKWEKMIMWRLNNILQEKKCVNNDIKEEILKVPWDKWQAHKICSVTQSCLTLCNLIDCSTSGFPVHHQLPELAQTHVHWAGDAIQPSHPLLSPSPTFNLSQHQGPFKWVSSSHQVGRVLEFQLQHESLQWIFRTDFLWTGLILQSKGLARVFSNATIQKHQFFSVQLSL